MILGDYIESIRFRRLEPFGSDRSDVRIVFLQDPPLGFSPPIVPGPTRGLLRVYRIDAGSPVAAVGFKAGWRASCHSVYANSLAAHQAPPVIWCNESKKACFLGVLTLQIRSNDMLA